MYVHMYSNYTVLNVKGLNDGRGLTETRSPKISLYVNKFTNSCV